MRGLARVDALVGREVASWTAVVVVGALGLVGITGAVEGFRAGWSGLALALLRAPVAIVTLTPLLAALGAALAAARAEGRGERVALEGAGWSPARAGLAAAAVGLTLGLGAWAVADHGLHRTDRLAAALEARPLAGWVWLEGAAVRLPDGARVEASRGRIGAISQLSPEELASPELALAREVERPRTASAAALGRATTTPARVERQGRRARALGAAALAFIGWLPWSRRPSRQVGRVLVFALGWQLAELVLLALAAQGRLPVGACWAPPLLAWAAIGLGWGARRG